MKQAELTSLHNIEITETEIPVIKNTDDVLIKIESVGVCGSDIHYYRTGRIGNQVVNYPFRTGHEFGGKIIEVGKSVSDLIPGDRVAVDPLVSCGYCTECLAGREHTCLNQKFLGAPGQLNGALTEYLVMPSKCCFKIPDSLSYNQAALVEPLTIALHAFDFVKHKRIKSAVILGMGPIGLSVLLTALANGVEKIYVTDLLEYRLSTARTKGALYAGNAHDNNIIEDILKYEPEGVSAVFDCCGMQSALDQAVHLLKPGSQLVIVGIQEFDSIFFNPHEVRRKEITINSVRRQNHKIQEAIDLMSSGKIDNEFLITHQYPLSKTKEAFDLVESYGDGVLKAMINVSEK